MSNYVFKSIFYFLCRSKKDCDSENFYLKVSNIFFINALLNIHDDSENIYAIMKI